MARRNTVQDVLKAELVQAAKDGITQYLSTTRGAQYFRQGQAAIVPGAHIVQVAFKLENDNRLQFIELTAKHTLV